MTGPHAIDGRPVVDGLDGFAGGNQSAGVVGVEVEMRGQGVVVRLHKPGERLEVDELEWEGGGIVQGCEDAAGLLAAAGEGARDEEGCVRDRVGGGGGGREGDVEVGIYCVI